MHDFSDTIQRLAATAGPAVVGLGRGARGGSGVLVGDGRLLALSSRPCRRSERPCSRSPTPAAAACG
jgi:hypothetical protein